MNDQVRIALAATGFAFVVFFTCVFVFVFNPDLSLLGVLGIGIPLGVVIWVVLAILYALIGNQYLPP